MKKLSVGVDLHKSQFTVYWKSENGKIGEFSQYSTSPKGYEGFEKTLDEFKEKGYCIRAAVESTGNTRYFKDRVEAWGVPVTVINTARFKVITQSVKKTDRHDAATIAEFLEKDMLPESQICSRETEELRQLLKTRSNLVKMVVSVKNQIHGMLLGLGIETKKSSLQSKKSRLWIKKELEAHNLTDGTALELLMDTIDRLYEQVKKLEQLIEKKVENDRTVELIKSIPGAGLITAATVRAYIDDVHRFSGTKQFAAYAGLVPWVQNSNETVHHGHITKRGSKELRTAYVQIVLGMVRCKKYTEKYRLMVRYREMKKHKGSGASIIATARKLSMIIWSMLIHDEPFDPLRMSERAARLAAVEVQAALRSAV